MKKIYPSLFAVWLCIAGCSKGGSTDLNSATSTTTGTGTGTGTGNGTGNPTSTPTTNTYQAVWKLSGMSVDNIPRTLSTQQAAYYMILFGDGKYSDSDGITGNWVNPVKDSLTIFQTNIPKPIMIGYRITSQTTKNLLLTQGSGSSKIDLTYDAK
jgi:hypothetical protein